ncbi:MAG: glycosyltransferase family 4 protein [Desulfobacterales bacterium]
MPLVDAASQDSLSAEPPRMRVVMIAFTNIEYTIELAEALAKRVDVVLMIPDKQAKRFHDKISAGTNLTPYVQPRLRQPANLPFVYKMVKQINKLQPDVLHIQRGHPWFNFALPFFRARAIVTTIHDVTLHSGDRESSKIPQFTHKLAAKYADQIIVHGKALKQELAAKSTRPPEEINVLPRGVNSIYRRYMTRAVAEEDDTLLFFGRIWAYKGLKYLIEAEPLISRVRPGLKIIIAGRGEDLKPYYEMMVNKDKFIVYNQRIPDEMVAELFQRAGVVVLPYTDASQSGIVPLAYAFKKPVVVTEVGSLPEVVDHGRTGYIVPPGDPQKLAESIIALLQNKKLRKEMGENAYRMAPRELSWEGIADKTVAVYRRAIAGRRRRMLLRAGSVRGFGAADPLSPKKE